MGHNQEYVKATTDDPSPAESPLSCHMESSFQSCHMSWITRQDEEGSVSTAGEELHSKEVLALITSPVSPKPQRIPSPSRTSMPDSNLHTALYTSACAEQDRPPCNVQNMNAPISLHIMDGATLPVDKLQEVDHRLSPSLIQRSPSGTPSHCTCHNSEAIRALQYEVSYLKMVLEKTLGPLAHLSNMNTQEKSLSAGARSRNQNRSASSSMRQNTYLQAMEDWISSNIQSSKSNGTDSGESDNTEISLRPSYKSIHPHCKNPSPRRSCDLKYSSTASLENISLDTTQSKHNFRSMELPIQSSGASVADSGSTGPINPNIRKITRPASPGHTSNTSFGPTYHRNADSRSTGSVKSYSSLPSGLKVQEAQSEPEVVSRRHSTQSDSALLPSNVYFQWTSSLPTSKRRTGKRTRRHTVRKEEAINQTLDKALEAVLLMKQSTDRMAKTLSADLAKAQLHRKFHGLHPLSDREKP